MPVESEHSTTERDVKLQKVFVELSFSSIDINEAHKRTLVSLIAEYLDAFAASPSDVGRNHVILHRIDTSDAPPFKDGFLYSPLAWRAFLDQEIERLLSFGHILEATPGTCPDASRTVIVCKKDGSFRLCIEYRRLNAQTVKDAYPLPRVDDILTSLSEARYFAALDLLMGYHEIEVEPTDQVKTAFITHRGLFVLNVMPFGLKKAPATFQRLMNTLLLDLIGTGVLVY